MIHTEHMKRFFLGHKSAKTEDRADGIKSCLERIFGESVDQVRICEFSMVARLHLALATTRRNKIYLRGSFEEFWSSLPMVLEEYYHVLRQWNTRRLSVVRYLIESIRNGYRNNRWELEAKAFATNHVDDLNKLLSRE